MPVSSVARASVVTMAGKSLSCRCHMASGVPNSMRDTPFTRSVHRVALCSVALCSAADSAEVDGAVLLELGAAGLLSGCRKKEPRRGASHFTAGGSPRRFSEVAHSVGSSGGADNGELPLGAAESTASDAGKLPAAGRTFSLRPTRALRGVFTGKEAYVICQPAGCGLSVRAGAVRGAQR